MTHKTCERIRRASVDSNGPEKESATKRTLLLVAVSFAALNVPVTGGIAASREASAVPAKLVGCWRRNVTAADFTRAGTGGIPTGVWSIRIKSGGRLDTYMPGSNCGGVVDFTTNLSVTAGRLTLGSVPVCASKGAYRWKVAGGLLTLRAVADQNCPPRLGLFNGVWKRK
jgi:hypothetical protein